MDQEKKISAFMILYKPVQVRISAYCRVLTDNESDARDLLQDTLTAAFDNFQNLRNDDSFIFYLFKIAKNLYLKQKRRRKFIVGSTKEHESIMIPEVDDIDLRTDIIHLHEAISKLKPEQRDLILMFHILGFSISEIQKKTGQSEASIKNKLLRGRQRLKKMLSDKECRTIKEIYSGLIL